MNLKAKIVKSLVEENNMLLTEITRLIVAIGTSVKQAAEHMELHWHSLFTQSSLNNELRDLWVSFTEELSLVCCVYVCFKNSNKLLLLVMPQ